MDLTPFERAGWYNPGAPDAADLRGMLEELAALGVPTEELLRAFEGGYVHSAGLEPLLRRGEVSAREVATRLGVEVGQVVDTYRLIGVRIADPDERLLLVEEAELLELLYSTQGSFEGGEADEILRTTSAALAMLAESVVAVFVGGVETRIEGAGGIGWRARMEVTQRSGELGLRFGRAIGMFFRHHLREAIDRQRASMVGASDRHLRRMTVGFVDLVGFTALTASMDAHDLLDLVRDFERRSYDAASRAGGRVVKIIGDEVMVSALELDAGCDIVLSLIEEFRTGGSAPRAGLASGEVLGRLGDFFGPVVNLASRLTDLAVPGEVLADAAIGPLVSPAFRCEAAGKRLLKGFADPVPVVSVSRG